MSIKPLDLQTMFVQMHNVGKAEANEKNAAHLQQLNEGQALVEKELKNDHQVNKTTENEESEKIKDKEKEPEAAEQKHNEKHEENEEEQKENNQWLDDPEKGQNIDISG